MQKIVIMSRGEGSEENFVRLVEMLFPECEICVIPPDSAELGMQVNEPEPESRVNSAETCAAKISGS